MAPSGFTLHIEPNLWVRIAFRAYALVSSNAPMITSQEYQQRAQACLLLARESEQIFAKIGLIEWAAEFLVQAEAALRPREADCG